MNFCAVQIIKLSHFGMEIVYQHSTSKIGMNNKVDVGRINKWLIVRCSHPLHNPNFGHFTSLSRREWLRNVQKRKIQVKSTQSLCFCSLNLLFCGVLAAHHQDTLLLSLRFDVSDRPHQATFFNSRIKTSKTIFDLFVRKLVCYFKKNVFMSKYNTRGFWRSH